jgi:hypothetical protein
MVPLVDGRMALLQRRGMSARLSLRRLCQRMQWPLVQLQEVAVPAVGAREAEGKEDSVSGGFLYRAAMPEGMCGGALAQAKEPSPTRKQAREAAAVC